MFHQFDTLINSYLLNKVGIDADFIPKHLAKGLTDNIIALVQTNQMKKAGIGNANQHLTNSEIRTDKTYWLDKKNNNVFENEFLQLIEDLIFFLNTTCYTGINGYEFHYALYESGSYYKKHKDQFQSNQSRKFSLISYLNKDWVTADGGQLVTYQNREGEKISPNSGKAVFFKSDEMEHEVIVANKDRMSISGWLKQD